MSVRRSLVCPGYRQNKNRACTHAGPPGEGSMKKSRHDYCGDLNARSVGPVTAEAAINLPATELAIDIVAIRTAWRAGRSGFGCTDKPDRGERCGDIRERCRL